MILPDSYASTISPAVGGTGPERSFDIPIAHGHILEGTGSPWYSADIGIRDGKMAAIGRLAGARAKHVHDARGRMVAPGFIDILGQSERTVLVDPQLPSKIYQGITTESAGEGSSAAPLNEAMVAVDRADGAPVCR